jgi:hypothetical protein
MDCEDKMSDKLVYALGARIDDPVNVTYHSSERLIASAEEFVKKLNSGEIGPKVSATLVLVWARTAIRIARAFEELKEMEVE